MQILRIVRLEDAPLYMHGSNNKVGLRILDAGPKHGAQLVQIKIRNSSAQCNVGQ